MNSVIANRPINTDLFKRYKAKYVEKFVMFHHENPEIYREFVRVARDIRKHQDRYSAGAILEVVRWHGVVNGGDPIKVKNEYRSLYARLLAQEQPETFGNFFRFFGDKSDKTANKR